MSNRLFATFVSNDSASRVLVTDSSDGTHWRPFEDTGHQTGTAFAQTYFRDRFWAAFVAGDGSNDIRLACSVDGVNWPGYKAVGQTSPATPAIAAFDNRLWIAFLSNDSGNRILVCSSADGLTWSDTSQVGFGRAGCAPSLAAFDNRLWLAFVEAGESPLISTCSATVENDRVQWSAPSPTPNASEMSLALAVFDAKLWMAYVAGDENHALSLACLQEGSTNWESGAPIGRVSHQPPFLAVFNNRLWMSAVDGQGWAYIASSPDGRNWPLWSDIGQTTKAGVSLRKSETDAPEPPPPAAYSMVASDRRVFAGYRAMALYLNKSARQVIQEQNKNNNLYVDQSALPYQIPSYPSPWMTELWDVSQKQSGVYVGLRGKWLSNMIIPEAHDAMAIGASICPWYLPNGNGKAQDYPFGNQLTAGIRSFDMRYQLVDREYLGSHFCSFAAGSMQSCINALVEFFSVPQDRSREFIILKLRYGTGQNNETPVHTDDDALAMFRTFIDRLKAWRLLDRVLLAGQDASGNPLPDSSLPFATLEVLNSGRNGTTSNLLLTMQPDYLVDEWNEKYPGEPYFRPNSALETPGSDQFNGTTSIPRFGLSILGVDMAGLNPDRDGSQRLASVAVDAMLYNPLSVFLSDKNINDKGNLRTRNVYGGPWNYNFVAANFIEDSPFINNLVEMNKFNTGTDMYELDNTALEIKVTAVETGQTHTASIASGRYYGSLKVAREVERALNGLTPETGIDFGVDFDGQFTLHAKTVALTGPVAAVLSPASRSIEVFAVGTDQAVWHIRQTPLGPGPWSSWKSLGGKLKGTPFAIQDRDGRMLVFARGTDDTLRFNYQETPGSSVWSGWISLGGTLRSDAAAALNSDGRVEVFVRGTDNQVYHRWQTSPGDNTSWFPGWEALGGDITSTPAVVRRLDGTLEVFATWTDGSVAHIRQSEPNQGPWVPQGWAKLNRFFCAVGTPAVALRNWGPGFPQVVVRGTDNRVRYVLMSAAPDREKPWIDLGGSVGSDPVLGMNSNGHLEVFARGIHGDLQHIWEWSPNHWNDGWESLYGVLLSRPAVGQNADGRLEVFAPAKFGSPEHIWQTPFGPGPWSYWQSLPFPVAPPLFQLLETELSKRLGFGRGASKAGWSLTAGETIFPRSHYLRQPSAESV